VLGANVQDLLGQDSGVDRLRQKGTVRLPQPQVIVGRQAIQVQGNRVIVFGTKLEQVRVGRRADQPLQTPGPDECRRSEGIIWLPRIRATVRRRERRAGSWRAGYRWRGGRSTGSAWRRVPTVGVCVGIGVFVAVPAGVAEVTWTRNS